MGKLLAALLLLFASLTTANSVTAQGWHKRSKKTSATEEIYKAYADSLNALSRRYEHWTYKGSDTLSNPYYFQLFTPATLYVAPLRRAIGQVGSNAPAADSTSQRTLLNAIGNVWANIYQTQPWLVQQTEADVRTAAVDEVALKERVIPQVSLVEKVQTQLPPEREDDVDDDWNIVVRKPNFWSFKTNVSLQLMQNYISSNWYKGGESSNSWLAQATIEANYNNKQKVIFNNSLEMKLGFLSTHGDEEHKFRTNSDLLRLTNKLGLQATKHWYYTFLLQSWTQFYPGFKKNDTKVYSDFMSPFEAVFSVGMDYKLNVKKFTLTATIAPFACDLKYVDRSALVTSFGVDEGKHSDFSFGSNLTVKYDWNICKNVTWTGRIYYYTDYDRAQLEWENTFNLTINKYLSTKLFLYPRFDDGVSREEGESYIQFNELLSFGLNVSF